MNVRKTRKITKKTKIVAIANRTGTRVNQLDRRREEPCGGDPTSRTDVKPRTIGNLCDFSPGCYYSVLIYQIRSFECAVRKYCALVRVVRIINQRALRTPPDGRGAGNKSYAF